MFVGGIALQQGGIRLGDKSLPAGIIEQQGVFKYGCRIFLIGVFVPKVPEISFQLFIEADGLLIPVDVAIIELRNGGQDVLVGGFVLVFQEILAGFTSRLQGFFNIAASRLYQGVLHLLQGGSKGYERAAEDTFGQVYPMFGIRPPFFIGLGPVVEQVFEFGLVLRPLLKRSFLSFLLLVNTIFDQLFGLPVEEFPVLGYTGIIVGHLQLDGRVFFQSGEPILQSEVPVFAQGGIIVSDFVFSSPGIRIS